MASSEESQVKKFLKSKYTIDDDINHKMKASALYDIIISSKIVKIDEDKIAGFRNRLSKYLKDIGLQKKRYNDGFYYYGIVEKEPDINNLEYGINTRVNKPNINIGEVSQKWVNELSSYVHSTDLKASPFWLNYKDKQTV